VIDWLIFHLPPTRDLNTPSVRWMMEGAIEDDRGPISVIDLVAHEIDGFVAVT
jgi:hypothetical protein